MEGFPRRGRCKLTVRGGFSFIEVGKEEQVISKKGSKAWEAPCSLVFMDSSVQGAMDGGWGTEGDGEPGLELGFCSVAGRTG